MMRRLATALLVACTTVVVAEEAAPPPDAEGSVKKLKDLASQPGWSFTPPEDRRDMMINLINLKKKELEALARQRRENDADEVIDIAGPDIEIEEVDDVSGQFKAEEFARMVQDEVRRKFLEQKWERMIDHCDKRLRDLKKLADQYPKSRQIQDSISYVRNAKVQAEEKYRYEVAKAEFDALKIRVEGIIWSAEGDSLAIINNEPHALGLNDKVRNEAAVVVSIDQNRVDFMVVKDTNTFHFQRYIGDDD